MKNYYQANWEISKKTIWVVLLLFGFMLLGTPGFAQDDPDDEFLSDIG